MDKTTGNYSGSIGRVQHGEADLVGTPVYYPLNDPDNEHFDYSTPLMEDKMMIGSSYNYTEEIELGDVTSIFTSVSIDYWWSAATCFFVYVSLIKLECSWIKIKARANWCSIKKNISDELMHRQIPVIQVNGKDIDSSKGARSVKKRENLEASWLVLRAFFREDNFPSDKIFYRIVSASLCTFLFFFTTFILNCMSTDMVIVKDPIVISNYQDILDRKIEIVWPSFLPETQKFLEAEENTIQAKLWKQRVELPPEGTAVFLLMKDKLINQKVVTIVREFVIRTATAVAFYYAENFGLTGL